MGKTQFEVRQLGTVNRIGTLFIDDDDKIAYLDLQSLQVDAEPVGEQRVRLLGPFRVNYNDVGLGIGNGIKVADLPTGAIIIEAICEVVTAWDEDPDQATLIINAATGDGSDGIALRHAIVSANYAAVRTATIGPNTTYFASGYPGAPFVEGSSYSGPTSNGHGGHRIIDANGGLYVFATQVTNATQGAADIYALIAEPIE